MEHDKGTGQQNNRAGWRDPRLYQIASLSILLLYGLLWLHFDVSILQITITLGVALLTQYAGTRFYNLPSFDPKSLLALLSVPDPEAELPFVMEAVRRIKKALADRVPLIGFAGAPLTMLTYAVEGGGSKDYPHTKALIFGDPKSAHQLLDKLARTCAVYLEAQVAAGAQAVQIFDSWAGILSPAASLANAPIDSAPSSRERRWPPMRATVASSNSSVLYCASATSPSGRHASPSVRS